MVRWDMHKIDREPERGPRGQPHDLLLDLALAGIAAIWFAVGYLIFH